LQTAAPCGTSSLRPGREGNLAGEYLLRRWPASSEEGFPISATETHLRGIYALEGKDLIICFSESFARERPVEFTTGPGRRQLLLNLEKRE
jgi:hypothetical protein